HQVPQPAPPIPQSTTNRQLFIGDTNTAASVASKSKKGHDHTHHVSFFESCFSGLKAFVKLKINALIKKHVAHANSLRDDHISFEGGEGEPDQTKRKITIKVKAPASVFTNNFKQALQEFGKTLIDDFCKYKKIPTNQADHYEITVIPEVFEVTELNLNDLKAKIINALQQEADRLLGVHDCFPAYSLFRNDEVAVPKAAALTQLITQVNNKNNINEVIDVMIKVADRSCDIFAQERSDNYSYALLDKRQHEYWDAMVGCMGEKNSTTYDNLLSVFKTVQQFQDHYAKHQLTV
ncbi:MAG TPA: hypothetical protein VI522_02935, partial [Gammaproteobacteria bacterium]|nr:hypothetical protein [Gammaproteobacteria bacterium]